MKRVVAVITILVFIVALAAAARRTPLGRATTWQRLASPGELSAAHASLADGCAACHTAVRGVEAPACVACHADNAALLQRQPTAFHAHIQSCSQCHVEHQGAARRPTEMDHAALAKYALRELSSGGADDERRRVRNRLLVWIRQGRAGEGGGASHPNVTAEEAILDCAGCHSSQDKHFKLFGQDCAECHATARWTITEFKHPSPRSTDCAQCHQAPPSHYMEHFKMVSQRIAGRHDAQVGECYVCHQTNSWNDIKGVGWYKHH